MIKRDNIVWKEVEGSKGRYEISNYGDIHRRPFYTLKQGGGKFYYPEKWYPFEKHQVLKNGYQRFRIQGVKESYIHRLVATAFMPEKKEAGLEVNHKNGNKQDNRVENLEWCSHKKNCEHASKTGLINKDSQLRKEKCKIANQKARLSNIKPVVQISTDGIILAVFSSIKEAEKATGVKSCNISRVCRGEKYRKTAGGYCWSYK